MLRAGDHVRVDVREADVSPRTSVVDLCRVTEVLVPRVVHAPHAQGTWSVGPAGGHAGALPSGTRRAVFGRWQHAADSAAAVGLSGEPAGVNHARLPPTRDSHPAAVDVVAVVVAEVTSHTLRRVALRTFTWISAGSHTTHVRKRNRRDVRHVSPARASTRAAACGDQRRDDDESCHNSIHQLTYLSNMILTHVC